MKVRKLLEQLESIPDDAEVSYKLNFDKCSKCDTIMDLNHIVLVFTLGANIMCIHVDKEYEGLPKRGDKSC